MDMISRLPDAALVKILSNLPTKTAISTSILSKRWECLWMWLPKLELHYWAIPQSSHLERFIHRRLPLHKAPVLESLCFTFKVTGYCPNKPENIKPLIVVAVSRCIRELEITCFYSNPGINLPASLFTNKSLVILKLMGGGIFLEVIPRNVCLASLKTLDLLSVTYACEKSLQWLLSICPVLEDLFIRCSKKMQFIVTVPSLLRLSLDIPFISDGVEGFVINTPSLEYFKLVDKCHKRDYYMIHYMPKLVEAYVDVRFPDVQCFTGSMTSVNHLTLCHCLGSFHKEVVYEDGFVFNQLEHIKLCVCSWHKSNILNTLLNDSPYLQSLELFRESDHQGSITCWNEPTMVPECLLSSLQIFKWSSYSGSQIERDIAVYILRNAPLLKTTTISSSEYEVPKHEMLKELALSSRASTTCQLIFE